MSRSRSSGNMGIVGWGAKKGMRTRRSRGQMEVMEKGGRKECPRG